MSQICRVCPEWVDIGELEMDYSFVLFFFKGMYSAGTIDLINEIDMLKMSANVCAFFLSCLW